MTRLQSRGSAGGRGRERLKRHSERERGCVQILWEMREEANRKEMKDKAAKSWKWHGEMEKEQED